MPRILCDNNLSCCPRDWWRNLPNLSLANPTDACVCQDYTFTFAVASGGTAPFTWTISSVPEGLSFDPTTGTLSGVPVFADTYEFTVTVSDVFDRTDNRDFVLIVDPADSDDCGIEMNAVAVTAFDGSYVDLAWDSPSFLYVDDAFYRIFRNGVLLVQLSQGTNTYTDSTVESAATYEYEVFFHHGSECVTNAEVRAILDTTDSAILDSSGFAILES